MTQETPLSRTTARLMLLAAQGLLNPPVQPATKADVLAVIRRMGVLQIDTINVVARSPYLVLFSRLGAYDPRWLEELEAEGQLFEYWGHAACFIPIEDYPMYHPRMAYYSERYYTDFLGRDHQDSVERVMRKIREEGPVRSADFERTDGRKGSWWDWKVEKRVLEYLHTHGHLMILKRENFQRVYDLRERVLPNWDDSQAFSPEAAEDAMALKAVRALGAAPARWVPDYFRQFKNGMAKRLNRLCESGQLEQVAVEDWKEPWYVHKENHSLLEQARAGELQASYTTVLSPFDPLTWDRERARMLFDFDYTIECYLPEAKRKYGYFSLPLLHNGQLIGRLDAKAYRKEKVFEVRALYLEPGVRIEEPLITAVREALQRCADWHGTPQVEIRRTEPEGFAELLKA